MKKSLFFALIICLSVSLFAQTQLKGAMGLTFGMNKSAVKKIMVQKGGTIKISEAGNFDITNVSMGTKKPDLVTCKFVNDKLYEILVFFSPVFEAKTQELYDELKGIITSKYGKASSFRDFTDPYEDGDGHEIQAVKLGKADIKSYWTKSPDRNAICLEIAPFGNTVTVLLTYQCDALINEIMQKKAVKDNAEF